jgi:hypothetical protein
MKLLILVLAVAAFPFSAAGQAVIAQDSNGLVVDIKADYGHASRDTCTVVVLTQENFVLVHKNGSTAWYPLPFHSVKVIEHLKPTLDPLANAEKSNESFGRRLDEK